METSYLAICWKLCTESVVKYPYTLEKWEKVKL